MSGSRVEDDPSLGKYTEKARRVLFFARYQASEAGSAGIDSGHLWLAILRESQAMLNNTFKMDGGARQELRARSASLIIVEPQGSTGIDAPLSEEGKRIVAYAADEAASLQQRLIGPEHLLLGILREEQCFAAGVLRQQGLDLEQARRLLAASESASAGYAVPVSERSKGMQLILNEESGLEPVSLSRNPNLVPRVGEMVTLTHEDGRTHSYRVRNVVWRYEGAGGTMRPNEVELRVSTESERDGSGRWLSREINRGEPYEGGL